MGLAAILALVDAGMVTAAFISAYYVRFSVLPMPAGIGRPSLLPYLYSVPVVVIIWLVILKVLGLYDRRRCRLGLETVALLGAAALLGSVFSSAVGFVYRGFSYSRLYLGTASAMAFVALAVGRATALSVRSYLLKRGVGARRTLVVGSSPQARELCARLRGQAGSDYYLLGMLPSEGAAKPECPVLGRLEEFYEVVERERVDVVFFGSDIPQPLLLDMVLACDLKRVDVRIIPSTLEIMASKVYADEALGIPIFAIQQLRLKGFNRGVKRALDVAFSAGLLVLFSPLMVFIAILVKLTSPGPVLYRQERVGQDGKTFTLYKFRSMRADAEAGTGPVFAAANDERVTPLGRILRRTSLDELPQFFNVLKGDMSVVGPRPERPYFVEKFASDIPRYLERHKVKSGMTGWAQVNGLRGNTSIARRLEYDLYYIENWSLLFDLRIILRTAWHVITGKGS